MLRVGAVAMCNLLICVVLVQNERRETALFAACSKGHYDPAALLIDHGADVNYLSKVRPWSTLRGRI